MKMRVFLTMMLLMVAGIGTVNAQDPADMDYMEYTSASFTYDNTFMGVDFEVFAAVGWYQSLDPRYQANLIVANANGVDTTTREWSTANSNYRISYGDAGRHLWFTPDLRWNLLKTSLNDPVSGHVTLANLHAQNENWASAAAELNDAIAELLKFREDWAEPAGEHCAEAEMSLTTLEMIAADSVNDPDDGMDDFMDGMDDLMDSMDDFMDSMDDFMDSTDDFMYDFMY